jgi:hypothetical protein
MNRYNFLQTGGFPFEVNILEGMQKAFEIFNCLGALAGPKTIISGCVATGSNISNGFVHIDGEIYPFLGGTAQGSVVIITTTQSAEFEDLTTKEIKEIKHVQFGTGVGSILWADFKRPETTTQLTTLIQNLTTRVETLEAQPDAIPVGMIAIWDRPAVEIPVGWAEYLPLRGRMPVGVDPSYTQGADNTNYGLEILNNTGGKREHKLTKPELPNYNLTRTVGNETVQPGGVSIASSSAGSMFTQTIPSGGEDKAHTNMSPYRVVHFIKYTG